MLWSVAVILVLAGLSLLAYSLGALDRAGALASFALGLVIAFAGGLEWILLMAAFTGLGILATRVAYEDKTRRRVAEDHGGERGRTNVLANGGAPALAALTVPIEAISYEAAALAFATAVAAVTADTLASEIGAIQRTARMIVPPFRQTPAGENGAVSAWGQGAAAVGAGTIALLAAPVLGLPWHLVWIPWLGGFLGCQLDSLLGATLEGDRKRQGPLSKGDVNFIASTMPAFLVLVLAQLL